jgi:hypothetical protein
MALLEIGNWRIEKAKNGKETDKHVPVRMVANRLEVDRENQEILPQAFNKATIDKFVSHGIIDWHHQSVTGKTPEQRAQAILGKPYDFQWEDSLPVVYGNLTKAHPIVRDSILPHLEAEQSVFAASVGGNIRKARRATTANNKSKEQILEIDWEHLAIAGSPYVISPGSEVSLVKAYGRENAEVRFVFSDLSSFEAECDLVFRGDEIRKALEAGAGTDIAGLTSVDALRTQSLEGKPVDYKMLVEQVAQGLRDDVIGPTEQGVKTFLKSKGLKEDDIKSFMTKFNKTVNSVLTN